MHHDQGPERAPDDDSIAALFARLIADAENFVRAEFNLYRASLFARLTQARGGIVMILVGFLLLQSAMIALLVGLIVILRPSLGAIGATATVVGSAVVIAGVLAKLAIGRLLKATEIEERRP